MRQAILLCLACAPLFSQASITIASDGCRESAMEWNTVSIGQLVNLHGSFSYTDGLGVVTTIGDTACSGASSKSKGTSPESLTQIWRAGTSRETTIKVEVTNPDASTVQEDIYITNGGTETITQYRLNMIGYSVGSTIGGNCANSQVLRTSRFSSDYYLYMTWTGVVSIVWMSDMTQNASVNPNCPASGSPSSSRIIPLRNPYTSSMGDQVDTIAPGQTRHYTIMRRFYPAGTTDSDAAKDATIAYGKASPPNANWPDRRPIGTDFWGATSARTSNNPRGYFNSSLNALDTSALAAFMASRTANNISIMNARNPRPQGILLWDIEGYEMDHAFTYVAYPNKLAEVAPEMNAVIDATFAAYRAAGYRVGVTLRPQRLRFHDPGTRVRWSISNGTLASLTVASGVATATTSTPHGMVDGTVLPVRGATTTSLNAGRRVITIASPTTFTFAVSTPDGTYNESGIFIEYASLPPTCNFVAPLSLANDVVFLTGSFIYPTSTRTAVCVGVDEWQWNTYPDGPGEQTRSDDYNLALNTLKEKATYAINRWGVSIFYVDTNVTISGGPMINKLWQDMKAAYPDCLFIPEWELDSTYQPASAFLNYQTVPQEGPTLPNAVMQGHPESFPVIQVGDKDPNNTPENTALWKQSLLRGGAYFARAWFGDSQVTKMAALYASVEPTSRCVVVGNRQFCSAPRTAFSYPLVNRVYFASSQGGLNSSTFYCEQTDLSRCYVDGIIVGTYDAPTDPGLSGITHYQLRYYDFAGNLVSNPGSYGTIQ